MSYGQTAFVAMVARRRAESAKSVAKRRLDMCLALVTLIAVCPLLLLIAICIKVSDGGPVLFKQTRIGRNGERFGCLKFRTMVSNADDVMRAYLERNEDARREWLDTCKLVNDPRVTPLGGLLRRLSFDEIPQLFNVVVGDMSLVGPRPIVESEMARYGDKLATYLSVRPGLTGLWQVSGRNDRTYEERVALDARYVVEWSFSGDILIMLRTLPAVIMQRGSY